MRVSHGDFNFELIRAVKRARSACAAAALASYPGDMAHKLIIKSRKKFRDKGDAPFLVLFSREKQ